MLKIDGSAQDVFSNMTYFIETPDGEMFVSIMEDSKGNVCAIDIKIGKAGSSLVAWAHSLARIATMAIEHGATIDELVTELSMQTSDKTRLLKGGIKVRSGPEALFVALIKYKNDKFAELKASMNIDDDDLAPSQTIYGRRF